MNRVFRLYSRFDMVLEASGEWRRRVYVRTTCPTCGRAYLTDPCHALDIELDHRYLNECYPKYAGQLRGPIVGIWAVEAMIVTEELAANLGLNRRGFCLGRVVLSGEPCDPYVTVVPGASSCVRLRNDRVLEQGDPCVTCGRAWQRVDFNSPFWVPANEVAHLDVFSGESRKQLCVTEQVLSGIRDSIKDELNVQELEVR